MASSSALRLGLVVALTAGLLAACTSVQPVAPGTSGLLTGPGGPADNATGGQANDAHGDNNP